jgi:NTP pyrophosphatase (non-canonical NTP hydrolase)
MCKLTFDELRRGNTARIPHFKNKHGERAHPKDDGSDWSILEWCGAATGELGELSNIAKKVKRGDLKLTDFIEDKGRTMTVRAWMAREIADVICYADIIALQIGADLGNAIIEKFNEISSDQGLPPSCFIGDEP